jgi:hypothetical protein
LQTEKGGRPFLFIHDLAGGTRPEILSPHAPFSAQGANLLYTPVTTFRTNSPETEKDGILIFFHPT